MSIKWAKRTYRNKLLSFYFLHFTFKFRSPHKKNSKFGRAHFIASVPGADTAIHATASETQRSVTLNSPVKQLHTGDNEIAGPHQTPRHGAVPWWVSLTTCEDARCFGLAVYKQNSVVRKTRSI